MPIPRPGRITPALAIVVASASTLVAWQTTQAPVFRDATDLVRVEFLAVSKAGDPVRDLKPAEISVRLNGRDRTITSLQFVGLEDSSRRGSESEDVLAPAFGTNSASEQGRSILLLLDDDSIGPGDEERVRESVDHLLDAMGPRDRVALMTAPFGVVKVNFTPDRGRIRQALAQITGRAPARIGSFSDFGCRTRQTLDSFSGAIRSFRRGDGLPVVVVISGGIMEPRSDAQRIAAPNPVTGERPASAPDPCDVLYDDYRKLRETAGASGLHFFVARAERRNMPPSVGDSAGRSTNIVAGLEHLASALNAPLINLTGSDGTPMLRVLQRTAGYYVMGFAPDAADRTGEARPLELRTARSGITLQVPISVMVPRAAANAAPATDATELLKVTAVFRDLPLRATAVVSRDKPDNTLRIVGLGEPVDPKVTIASAAIGLVDANGRLAAQSKLDAAANPSSRLMAVFSGPGGSYRLRVAAIDSLGRMGTADYDFTAELAAAGSVRLSDILLGVARESGFTPVLAFGNEVAATAYLELYGAQAGVNVRAAFDIAETLNGPAVQSQVAVFAATDEPDKFVATAVLPIGTLPPGDYVVRAAVALEKQPVTRVARALRKTGK